MIVQLEKEKEEEQKTRYGQAMVDAAPEKIVKYFKGTETYMAPSGIMMERSVYYLIPEAALQWPDPHKYAVALTHDKPKPKGKLFTGKNRKERRKELKVGKRKSIKNSLQN